MRKRFHGLKKVKVRQDWSKWTLYNLSRLRAPTTHDKTYFQQKWAAKSLTRAYHGEQVREKQWQRMFRTRIPAVVPMDHKYLARYDGSEQAAGRGSGEDERPGARTKKPGQTPYMQMVYYPMERRLDTAIFRALFATSTRQARQFVVHGFVKVNGKKMIYPGYLLNPGDMFSVEPERVMWATADKSKVKLGGSPAKRQQTQISRKESKNASPEELQKTLLDNAAIITSNSKAHSFPEKLSSLHLFTILISRLTKATRKQRKESKLSITTQLDTLKTKLSGVSTENAAAEATGEQFSKKEEALLTRALEEIRDNPVNEQKNYPTPWRPRPYMSAFAFIPRFLEVNQNICSAVYLRHPVARPGLGEVPTPFGSETSQLAFNWYLRRR